LTAGTNPGLLAVVSPFQIAVLLSIGCLAACAAGGRLAFLARDFVGPWRRLFAALLLAAILAAVVFYPLAGGLTGAQEGAPLPRFPALFLGHILLLLFLVGWWWLQRRPSPRTFLALALDHVREDLRYGVWLGLGGWGITILVTMAAVMITPAGVAQPPQEVPELIAWLVGLSLPRRLLVIFVAMTVEELFFRGFLQPRIGLMWSSLLFTMAHANYGLPFMMISVLTISLLIGYALRKRGRLLPCIVAHGVFDAIQLLLILPWAVRMMRMAG
jgi:membrane protease YdiL (CAAX protease family)